MWEYIYGRGRTIIGVRCMWRGEGNEVGEIRVDLEDLMGYVRRGGLSEVLVKEGYD